MQQILIGNKKGVSIIEILIVITVLSVTFASFLSLVNFSLMTASLVKQTTQADSLAKEAMEVVRVFRDSTSWSIDGLASLIDSTAYHPEKTAFLPPEWDLVLGQESIGKYTREIVFKAVYRDVNDDIASLGALDADTKKVIVTVNWEERGRPHEVVLTSYFTNWQK
ncbi:MAG: hypothetical protein ABH805_01045 [Candidatus Nealsonbacteria bacterium]